MSQRDERTQLSNRFWVREIRKLSDGLIKCGTEPVSESEPPMTVVTLESSLRPVLRSSLASVSISAASKFETAPSEIIAADISLLPESVEGVYDFGSGRNIIITSSNS
jgi:hypothetical protein